jgi:GNAT superfamily N-acetyltransferase
MNIDKSELLLKRASESDIDTIINYRIIFLKETYGDPSSGLENGLRLSLKKYFSSALKAGAFISWIAEYKSKPVGFSGMVIREQPGNFDIPNGKTGYILNIFTSKEYRKNGIASLLMEKLIEEGRQLNLDRVELRATRDGEPVYRKLGFTEPHDLPMELNLR